MGELGELTGAMRALKNVKSVKMENAGKFESVKGLKEVMEAEKKRREEEEERKRREEMMALAKSTVSVKCVEDLKNANCYVGVIVIASNCCNDSELNMLDMSRFVNLRELIVGDECFENVNEMKLIGLAHLERVVIGEHCFTKAWPGYNPSRHFYLKNCERVRELKIGCWSFSYYSVCKIENVPSLEAIEMGELRRESVNFYYASLKLKS